MKNGTKNKRPHGNGHIPTRAELLAANERALQHDEKLTEDEFFKAAVRAGIYTREGKLTRRYGGKH